MNSNRPVIQAPNHRYVAITGFNSLEELKQVNTAMIYGHDIFLGALVSSRSFHEERSSPRHVLKKELISMLGNSNPSGPYKFIAHFNTNKGLEHEAPDQVRELAELVGAVQLNIADPVLLAKIFEQIADTDATIIFQLNKTMAALLGEGSLQFYRDLWEQKTSMCSVIERRYRRTYILFDMSGGQGQKMNLERAQRFVKTCRHYQFFEPAVAGGLTPENVMDGINLRASVDIETNVRTNEIMDITKANQFLSNIREALIQPAIPERWSILD